MSPQASTTSAPAVIGKFSVHPVATLFPVLEGSAREELKKSISKHGQQEPIIIQKGVLVDGRNRLLICLELGIEPPIEEYSSPLPVEQFILVKNLFRRHLTDD